MPEIEISEQISDLGLRITSNDPVSVYVYNGKNVSSDGYLAIPVQSWGSDYFNLSYCDFNEFRPWKGGFAFVAGQLPFVPGSDTRDVGTIEEQTEQVIKNVAAVLDAAGSSLSRCVQMTIYISDMELWGRVNAVYARMLGDHKPARAVVPVLPLHYGYQIEVQAIGAVGA